MLMGTRFPESAASSTRLKGFTLIFLALSFLTVHFYTDRANTLYRVRRARRHSSAGANPARQLSLQPVAVGADDGGNDIV